MNKDKFLRQLQSRVPARLHMTLICILTMAGGILFSKALLHFNFSHLMVRYGFAVLFSYVIFLFLVYVWLRLHVTLPQRTTRKSNLDTLDGVDIDTLELSLNGNSHGCEISSRISGPWNSGNIEIGGKDLSPLKNVDIGDSDEGVIIILVVALIAAIFGSTAYIIYQAPEILFEAAFEAVLVAGIYRRAKNTQSEGWIFSVFRRTWIPFCIVLVMALIFGFSIKRHCPGISSFREYRQLCWGQSKKNLN